MRNIFYRIVPMSLSLLAGLGCGRNHRDASRDGTCLPYEPKLVALSGTLQAEQRFGPPNYGEDPKTDMKMRILVLHLGAPVGTCGEPGNQVNPDSLTNLQEIQLIVEPGLSYDSLVGRRVVAQGALEQATLGPHFTKVVMNTKDVHLGVD